MWLGLPDIVPSNTSREGMTPTSPTSRRAHRMAGRQAPRRVHHRELIHEASGDLRTALFAVAADRTDKFAISGKRLGWWLEGVLDRRVVGLCITRRLLDGRHRYKLYQPPTKQQTFV